MDQSITDQVKTIDGYLRQGKGELACRGLKKITSKKVPRPHALTLASLARRANLLNLALRILNPIVRPTPKNPVTPTEAEKAEYASSLALLGLSEEALAILTEIDSNRIPESLLYQAFAMVSEWNYGPTIPLLLKYAASSKITEYQRIVGKVNLAAAYVHERLVGEASEVLAEIREETARNKLRRLYGNTLELSAQNAISQKKWREAEKFLNQSQKALEATKALDVFFVDKWQCILRLLKSNGDTSARAELHKLRSRAKKLHHWETVRDCDQYEVICRKDNKLLIPLFYGTPFECFRKRLLEDFGPSATIPDEYHWQVGKGSSPGWQPRKHSPSQPTLYLSTGIVTAKRTVLKPGQSQHRLLMALSSDFYRPLRITSLHTRVYPQEFFNPISSPVRIYQLTKRLRKWLKKVSFPVEILEKDGYYHLSSEKPYTIILSLSKPEPDKDSYTIRQLKQIWPKDKFSVADAGKRLNSSPSALHRLLRKALEQGQIKRHGRSSATLYSFKK